VRGTVGSSELNRLAQGVVVPLVVELPVGLCSGHEAAVRSSVGPAEFFPILLDGVQAMYMSIVVSRPLSRSLLRSRTA